MHNYLWWLLPAFLKKSSAEDSNLKGLLGVIGRELAEIKSTLLKSRLSKFISPVETNTDYYQNEAEEDLIQHAADRGLPALGAESLLLDAHSRSLLGTKQGMKVYLELLYPEVRVDFLYELGADNKKWILFSSQDLGNEALFNRSVLSSSEDLNLGTFTSTRGTRIYSSEDQVAFEFLFWVKVYNPITDNLQFAVYPEKILASIDRLKPAHTRGFLLFNFLDPEMVFPSEGQVFVGNNIDISGGIRIPAEMAQA